MSYINNFNPRRMIWFNQSAPQNKMDLWLSYNRHNSEDDDTILTTDNPNQRNCDLILKAWDCGEWIPIVGFNTTSANKINITKGVSYSCTTPNHNSYSVTGNTVFHLPLFRGDDDSPDELFDAGTLGDAIYEFVTEPDWNKIFNSSWFQGAFNTSVIGGDDYNWNTLIQGLLNEGDVTIPWADTDVCGGINTDRHSVDITQDEVFIPAECKYYPDITGYQTAQYSHRLCLSAKLIIDAINGYNLYQYEHENYDSMQLVSGLGIMLFPREALPSHEITTTVMLKHNDLTDHGKFLKIKDDGSDIDWVDIQAGTGVNIATSSGTSGVTMVISASGGTEYTEGEGISISTGNVISLDAVSGTGNTLSTLLLGGVKAQSITEVYFNDSRPLDVYRKGDNNPMLCVEKKEILDLIPNVVEYQLNSSGSIIFYASGSNLGAGEYVMQKNTYYIPSSGVTGDVKCVLINDYVNIEGESTIFAKQSYGTKSTVVFDRQMSFVPTTTIPSGIATGTTVTVNVYGSGSTVSSGITLVCVKKDSVKIDQTYIL